MSLPSCSAVAYVDTSNLISYGTTAPEATNNMENLLNMDQQQPNGHQYNQMLHNVHPAIHS